MDHLQPRELHEALLDADAFEDLPGKWQAAVLAAEQSRPKFQVVSDRPSQLCSTLNLSPEAVRLAHRRERLDRGPRARPGQGVQGRQCQLRLPL